MVQTHPSNRNTLPFLNSMPPYALPHLPQYNVRLPLPSSFPISTHGVATTSGLPFGPSPPSFASSSASSSPPLSLRRAIDSGPRSLRTPSSSHPQQRASRPSSHGSVSRAPMPTIASTSSSKVSCLACRAAKRKCHTTSTDTVCRRCNTHRLSCEYREHRRGRKRKLPEGSPDDAMITATNSLSNAPVNEAESVSDRMKAAEEEGEATGSNVSLSPPPPPTQVTAPMPPPPRPSGIYDEPQIPSFSQWHNVMPARRAQFSSTSSLSHNASHDHMSNLNSGDPAQHPLLPLRNTGIHFSHLVSHEGGPTPYLRKFSALASDTTPGSPDLVEQAHPSDRPSLSTDGREHAILQKMLQRPPCPDPVDVGLLSEEDSAELFDFYFGYLNVTIAMLDPAIHTWQACRQLSSLLFTSVLTVTSQSVRPEVYKSCLLLANKLVAEAVEASTSSIEVVQALNILAQWKKADDSSSWRRVGYAIRLAQELKLHLKCPRPLPADEMQARHVLNKERTWLNLIIADYHLAIHHSLPRMMGDEGAEDPTEWITTDHRSISTPGEIVLAPTIAFSRMCRLYADMLVGMNGDPSNLRMLKWIEQEWKRWRTKWVEHPIGFGFVPQQMSTLKLFDAYYRFHICEYRLLYTARYRLPAQDHDTSSLPFAFGDCTDAALGLCRVFQEDFAQPGYLRYCFNLTWVSLAVTSIWLVKNYISMPGTDRSRVTEALGQVQRSSQEASNTPDDMPAYMFRLLKHLLAGMYHQHNHHYQQNSSAVEQAPIPSANDGSNGSELHGTKRASAFQPMRSLFIRQNGFAKAIDSTQRMIQDDLWTSVIGNVSWSGEQRQDRQQANQEGLPTHNQTPLHEIEQSPCVLGGMPDAAPLGSGESHLDMSALHAHLFPTSDDDIWKLLFPVRDETFCF